METPASVSSSSQLSTHQAHSCAQAQPQPPPQQPLIDIAAGISSIVAELKAVREGATVQGVQGVQAEELLRLDTEIKQLHKTIEEKLAESDQKQSVILSILLKMEAQQKGREGEKEKEVDT